jgi:hypothetical protein
MGRCYRPSAISLRGGVRHGVGVGGEKRCSGTAGGSGAAGGASRRWQCHPRDQTRVRSGVAARRTSLLSPWPSLPLIGTVRRGSPAKHGLGIPDQDARSGPTHGRWAKYGGDQTNILPLDLSSLSSFFNFLLKISIHIFHASFLFHYRLVHRTVPSSHQLVPLD